MGSTRGGYAQLNVGGKTVRVCRLILERKFGQLPSGIVARHTCDIKCCIAEDHLIKGTDQDNKDDMVQRGRSARGEKQGHAKLSAEQVFAIRASIGSQAEIGRQFGVGRTAVGKIKRRELWVHLPEAPLDQPAERVGS